jgi:hypothetical protein
MVTRPGRLRRPQSSHNQLILLAFRRRPAAHLTALRWVREWADVAGWFFWTYAGAGAILWLGDLPGAGWLTRDGAIA